MLQRIDHELELQKQEERWELESQQFEEKEAKRKLDRLEKKKLKIKKVVKKEKEL